MKRQNENRLDRNQTEEDEDFGTNRCKYREIINPNLFRCAYNGDEPCINQINNAEDLYCVLDKI